MRQCVTVLIEDDLIVEDNEVFLLQLMTSEVNTEVNPSFASVTITDNDGMGTAKQSGV